MIALHHPSTHGAKILFDLPSGTAVDAHAQRYDADCTLHDFAWAGLTKLQRSLTRLAFHLVSPPAQKTRLPAQPGA